jgi:hypothetical protein
MKGLKFLPLLVLFAACAPAPTPNAISTSVAADEVSYYPSQSGLTWAYLKPGESEATAPYVVRVEGPSSYQSRVLTAIRFVGRGTERFYYREFDNTGVKLWGEGSPDFYGIVYDRPVQEYPAESTIAVGKSWSGDTTAKLTTRQGVYNLRYTYTFRVVSKEKFKIRSTEYDTFLILRDSRLEYTGLSATDAAKPEFRPIVESQRIRFVPFIGEIQTREGLVLVDYNFKPKPK